MECYPELKKLVYETQRVLNNLAISWEMTTFEVVNLLLNLNKMLMESHFFKKTLAKSCSVGKL